MTSVPVVAEDQKSAFEPFVIDFPAAAPATRLPPHVLSTFQAFLHDAAVAGKKLLWRVGHVPPIGWFILHENGAPVYVENHLAMPAFWRLHDEDKLKKDPEIEALEKRIEAMREGVDAGHSEREHDKHVADLSREMMGRIRSKVYVEMPDQTDEAGNVPNQAKPSGITAGATPDPANPNIEADKAAATSSISSDSLGAPGNKTMQPHGTPDAIVPPRTVSDTNADPDPRAVPASDAKPATEDAVPTDDKNKKTVVSDTPSK